MSTNSRQGPIDRAEFRAAVQWFYDKEEKKTKHCIDKGAWKLAGDHAAARGAIACVLRMIDKWPDTGADQ